MNEVTLETNLANAGAGDLAAHHQRGVQQVHQHLGPAPVTEHAAHHLQDRGELKS